MQPRMSSDRLGAFSDAVIAVIITVMVLELKAPDGSRLADLLPLWPTAVSYAVSYVFIAIIWINHHHLLHFVRRPTPRLIWLNFAHLFVVSLLPFTTAWVARSHMAPMPVAVYAAIFLLIDLAYLFFEREILAQTDRTAVPERARSRVLRRTLLAVSIFTLGAITAPFLPLVGFGIVCSALVLYLSPETVNGYCMQPTRSRQAIENHNLSGDHNEVTAARSLTSEIKP